MYLTLLDFTKKKTIGLSSMRKKNLILDENEEDIEQVQNLFIVNILSF